MNNERRRQHIDNYLALSDKYKPRLDLIDRILKSNLIGSIFVVLMSFANLYFNSYAVTYTVYAMVGLSVAIILTARLASNYHYKKLIAAYKRIGQSISDIPQDDRPSASSRDD